MNLLALGMFALVFSSQVFGQFQNSDVQTSNFGENIKCQVLDLHYKHFLYFEPNADRNSYTVSESSNLDRTNPYKDYKVIDHNVAATAYSYGRMDYGAESAIFFTDWVFEGPNISLAVTINTDRKVRGTVFVNSALNSAFSKNSNSVRVFVHCQYE